jgi:hypothetical protein
MVEVIKATQNLTELYYRAGTKTLLHPNTLLLPIMYMTNFDSNMH